MEREFVGYAEALALKELGFNEEESLGYYRNSRIVDLVEYKFTMENYAHVEFIPAPLYQQAFRWFRDNYDLVHFITPEGSLNNRCYLYSIKDYRAFKGTFGQTYEEAELNCLKELIEIAQKDDKR